MSGNTTLAIIQLKIELYWRGGSEVLDKLFPFLLLKMTKAWNHPFFNWQIIWENSFTLKLYHVHLWKCVHISLFWILHVIHWYSWLFCLFFIPDWQIRPQRYGCCTTVFLECSRRCIFLWILHVCHMISTNDEIAEGWLVNSFF